MVKLIILAPCLLSPFYVYRGPKEKEYKTALEIRKVLFSLPKDWQIFAYPCPEFELLRWPRPPMSREVFERFGIRKVVEEVADFIGRVIVEERPEAIVFVGVKGSPTCGVYTTTSSDPDLYPVQKVREFFYMRKDERLAKYKDIIEEGKLTLIEGPGALFDELMKRFSELDNTFWVEIDKDNVNSGIEILKTILKKIKELTKD
ncbi:DUF523 domain-containing protein [Pyrococcus abyssi]|uniref:DUF523 domain-containing protein n=1 Tax=Pyrococcus abyssi (strain GE5 / Orsay) TaxID=272844 RepID=Q9UYU0_PYRAB|nr:DUF523 domain-containing protein [Pyrococcus abyssi]CAB50322.1 Hypothetical protein PAB0939 [Pyrococcus abyssi GE5]CCE70861.1 TPA: hypothetical protein PAB0939 [Pyrococcus abyssi GE5]